MIELSIYHKGKIYFPLTVGEVTLTSNLGASCSVLNFKVVKDDTISFLEGDTVTFVVDGVKMFKGFVFIKKRDKNNIIDVICYDQIRFLLNKDTIIYENLTATGLIKNICSQYKIKTGDITNTNYIIQNRIDVDRKLLDMIQTSLNITLSMTNKKYVFYDDFMKVTLKNINDMKTNYLLDEETATDYIYESSINDNTYNQIKVIDDITKKTREIVVEKDEESIKKFGVLQKLYYLKEELNPREFAKKRLDEFKNETRKLTVYGAIGKLDLRAGNSILVDLNLGDTLYHDRFLITYLKHRFVDDYHDMDLTLTDDKCLSK